MVGTSSSGATTAADGTTTSTSSPEETSSTGGSEGSSSESSETGPGEGSSSTGPMVGTSTGDPGNVVYSAVALPGGLDRIRIHKADLDADRCTWVVLVAPPIAGPYPGMMVPAGWSVESISINDVAAACDADNPFMFGSEPALDANGTIGFGMLGGTGIYPCTVDIDAVFDFQGILPMIPPMDAMTAAAIPVTGC